MKEELIVQSTLNVSLKVILYSFQNQVPTNQSSYVMLVFDYYLCFVLNIVLVNPVLF